MRLLGSSKKKQYEANLYHSTGGHIQQPQSSVKKAKNVSSDNTPAHDLNNRQFKPIDPSPLTQSDGKRSTFWSLFRENWHLTSCYCLVFWSFGMCVAFLGPTLSDLGCRTETPFAAMSWVFFAQALFTLLGSVVGGVIVQRVMDARPMIPGLGCVPCMSGRGNWRMSAHAAMMVSLVMLSVTLSLVPQCWSLAVLALNLATMGLFMGIIDTIANLCMIQLYGSNVAPFLQALHFFYALGAFASPLINEPFLLTDPSRCFELIDRLSSTDDIPGAVNNTQTEHDIMKLLGSSEIQYGFWIMAFMQVPVMVVVITVLCRDRSDNTNPQVVELDERGAITPHNSPGSQQHPREDPSVGHIAIVTVLVILICFLYDGLQGAYGGYIYSFATEMVANVSSTEAAYLNSCFWGSFALGRLLSIVFAAKFSPVIMILCNITGCGLAALLMMLSQHSLTTIYVGTCLFGLSLSSVYPTAISLAESYINITSLVTSLIVVGAAAGEMVQPVIVGHEFTSIGPTMFLINILLVVFLSVVFLVPLLLVGASIKGKNGVIGSYACCFGNYAASGEQASLVECDQKPCYTRMPRYDSVQQMKTTTLGTHSY